MQNFEFQFLRKVTIWHSSSTSVEAQSYEEAIAIINELGADLLEEFPPWHGDYMYDTEDELYPTVENTLATIEIENEFGDIVWDNRIA